MLVSGGRARLVSLSFRMFDLNNTRIYFVGLFANPGSHLDLIYNFLSHLSCLVDPTNVYFKSTSWLKYSNTFSFGFSSWIKKSILDLTCNQVRAEFEILFRGGGGRDRDRSFD